VSSTLERVDWNAELVHGDLEKAVLQLKRESGNGLFVGGVKLPLALAELGLIDEYEFIVQPRLAGHGPRLFAGLSKHIDLKQSAPREAGALMDSHALHEVAKFKTAADFARFMAAEVSWFLPESSPHITPNKSRGSSRSASTAP